jgi:hypothetical protein
VHTRTAVGVARPRAQGQAITCGQHTTCDRHMTLQYTKNRKSDVPEGFFFLFRNLLSSHKHNSERFPLSFMFNTGQVKTLWVKQ